MKKVFELEDLDCANCARKMQEAIAKIDGVKFVSVNFQGILNGTTNYILTKMEKEGADFDAVLKEAVKAVKKVEPDTSIII